MRAKRLRFAIIPDVITTDADSVLYFSRVEKLIQFFKKYCSDTEKDSLFMKFEKSEIFDENSTEKNVEISEKEAKERDREKTKKKKVDVNLSKIWLGTKSDPKWAFFQSDRLASDKKVTHVEVSEV